MILKVASSVDELSINTLEKYEHTFKALADKKRLHLLHLLSRKGKTCVCHLTEELEMSQSKLSYHLKILMDANLLARETKGTWSYYEINEEEMDRVLSDELCCVFKPGFNKC